MFVYTQEITSIPLMSQITTNMQLSLD